MDKDARFSELFFESLERPLRSGVRLSDYSTFKIGGPADYFFEARSEKELKTAVGLSRREGIPFYVIGGGSNLLFDDRGFRGLILKNAAEGFFAGETPCEVGVRSGTPLGKLVQFSLDKGLKGVEFLAGIPGTVGGAVFGNAGAFGRSIGDIVRDALLFDSGGGEVRFPRGSLSFGYRHSSLKATPDVVLGVILALEEGEAKVLRAEVKEILEKRRKKQPPWSTACAGSYFKNPVLPDGQKLAAGYLLEQAGAKGMKVGDAAVYSGHANFLINTGQATAGDVLRLADELKEKVRQKFGIKLEEEVIFLPESSSRF